MEIGEGRSAGRQSDDGKDGSGAHANKRDGARRFDAERVGRILEEVRERELRIARSLPECRGLRADQLEDLFQETVLALLQRPYGDKEHLLRALRMGIKHRALRLHRDERLHDQILVRNVPSFQLMAREQASRSEPEAAVLAREDRLVATEFTAELTEDEKRVFAWLAEGLQYRAIARVLDMPVNEARKAARSCARKSERFELLYQTGRLCGYRARTIKRLKDGRRTSEELAESAFAHLESCARCRNEHHTNAERLRASFRDQAAALLPPVLVGNLGWLTRLGIRVRALQHRLTPDGWLQSLSSPFGQGGGGGVMRERAAALLAGGGAAAKTAIVGVATVAVVAGGAVATHILNPDRHPASRHIPGNTDTRSHVPVAPVIPVDARSALSNPFTSSFAPENRTRRQRRQQKDGRAASTTRSPVATSSGSALARREPGGFAYLGVPRTPPPAATSTTPVPKRTVPGQSEQRTGGPFSP